MKTFIIAGQSNGTSSTNGGMPKLYSSTGGVKITHTLLIPGSETVYEDISGKIPLKSVLDSSTQCLPLENSASWIILGDMIKEATGEDCHFVNISQGGSTLYDWVTTSQGNNWLQRMESHCEAYQPDAVLWIQGESEQSSSHTDSQNDLNGYMISIVNAARSGASRVPFFIALDGWHHANGWNPTFTQIENMRARIAQRNALTSRIAWLGPDIDEMRYAKANIFTESSGAQQKNNYLFQGISGGEFPGAEFEGLGLIAHAQAWFNVLKP